MSVYLARGGEVIDEVALRFYPLADQGNAVSSLLEANTGLAAVALNIPPNFNIYLPLIQNNNANEVSLWS